MVTSNNNIRGGGSPKTVRFKQETRADDGSTANLRQKVYVRNPTKENKLAKLARQIDALSNKEKLEYYKRLSKLRNHMENARESRSYEWALRKASQLHKKLKNTIPKCNISIKNNPCIKKDRTIGKCRKVLRLGMKCACRVEKGKFISEYELCNSRCCNSREESNRANSNF